MVIYKVKNKINKKEYIGQTVKTLKKRITCHLMESKKTKQDYFHRAIKKYGIENFEWEIICECKNKKELDEKEKYYIKYYNTKRPNGYNLTDGGEGNLGWSPTIKTRKKISSGVKKSWENKTEEFKKIFSKNISLRMSGENNPMYGKIRPDCIGNLNPAKRPEVRKKISIKSKNRKHTEETKKKLSLMNKGILLETRIGKEKAIEAKNKMSKAHLGKKLRPKTEVEKELARQQRILNVYEAIDPNGKIIIFNSLHLFSKENNLNRCSIQYAIKNKSYHKGWKFKVIGVI